MGALKWLVRINATPFQGRVDHLGTDTSVGFFPEERECNLLKPGDHVLMKLALVSEVEA